MKKVLALAVLAVSVSFFACKNNEGNEGENNGTDTTVTTPAPEQTPAPADTTQHMDTTQMNNDTTHKM